jgi:hypothetical protein
MKINCQPLRGFPPINKADRILQRLHKCVKINQANEIKKRLDINT